MQRTTTAQASDEGGPTAPRDRSRNAVGVVLLLTVVAVGSAVVGQWDPETRRPPEPPYLPTDPPTPMATPLEIDALMEIIEQQDIQPWDLRWLAITIVLLLLGWLVWVLLGWLRRHPALPPPDGPDGSDAPTPGEVLAGPGVLQPDLPALREGVDDADDLLRRYERPADAVIAAWVRLEEAAARSGVPRDPASTPTEFTVDVLDRTPVDPTATRVLLDLYLRARFGREEMLPDDVAAAQAALTTLAEGLGEGSGG